MAEIDKDTEILLKEHKEQRVALKEMISSLELIKEKVDKLFPERIEFRNTRAFEEKVKATTELFKAILDIRKEVSKSVKDEIEVRRKIAEKENKENELENDESISRYADKIRAEIIKQEDNIIPIKEKMIK